MLTRSYIIAALLAILPGAGIAQKLPADCSKAAAPKQPLEVSVGGVKFTPKSITLRDEGGMKVGDDEFDSYRLYLRSEDDFSPPLEAGVTFIVRKGARIEGKVFRKLPIKDSSKQPMVAKSDEVEVQGWQFRNRPAKTGSSHAELIGSLRLELGQRQGTTISGNIYLCVAKGQTTIFNRTPTPEDSYAVGTFQARVEK